VILAVAEQPLASTTVAVCAPADIPEEVVADESPLLQLKVPAPVPPAKSTVASPSAPPLQLISSPVYEEVTMHPAVRGAAGSARVMLWVSEQPWPSVTETVYDPAARPEVVVAVVSAEVHK
jgi:hypothetical protein